MIRREMLKWGALVPAVASVPGMALSRAPEGIDAMLLDHRFGDGPVSAMGKARVYCFAGDVTKVWFDHLDRAWRQPGFVVGGITGTDALFVLEVLARQQGRQVVARNPLEEAPLAGGIAAVSWVIAPVHPSVRA